MASATKSAKRRNPEQTRAQIDEAAFELFADKGFAATATSEIAKRAGVAEGTIFRHYPTKKALLIGIMGPVVERVVVPLATKTIRKVLEARHDSVEAFLRALLDDRIALAKHLPRYLRVLMQEATLHSEVRDMMESVFMAQVYSPFVAQLDALKARNLVDGGLENDAIIRMVVSVVLSYVLLAHLLYPGSPHFDDDKEIDQMVRVLSRGLTPLPQQ